MKDDPIFSYIHWEVIYRVPVTHGYVTNGNGSLLPSAQSTFLNKATSAAIYSIWNSRVNYLIWYIQKSAPSHYDL